MRRTASQNRVLHAPLCSPRPCGPGLTPGSRPEPPRAAYRQNIFLTRADRELDAAVFAAGSHQHRNEASPERRLIAHQLLRPMTSNRAPSRAMVPNQDNCVITR